MKLTTGATACATNNLILRDKPGTSSKRLATIQKDVLVQALADPVGGWVKAKVSGWVSDAHPGKVFSEPDERSSIDAVRSAKQWQEVQLTGYVSTRYLALVDGPIQ